MGNTQKVLLEVTIKNPRNQENPMKDTKIPHVTAFFFCQSTFCFHWRNQFQSNFILGNAIQVVFPYQKSIAHDGVNPIPKGKRYHFTIKISHSFRWQPIFKI
jgi:hypothetical protein